MYDLGDTYTSTAAYTDPTTGNPTNPATVTAALTLPDGTTVVPSVSNPTTGSFTFSYVTTQAGQHGVTWTSTAPASVQSDVFNVNVSPSGLMISLADARNGLDFNASNTTSDEQLRTFIAAATPIMEDLIGSVVTRTRVETFDGGRPQIALMYPPLLSVTSVIESWSGTYAVTLSQQNIFAGGATSPYAFDVDLTTGILTRRASGLQVCFTPGRRNVQVTYLSGRVLRGNELLAARRLVKFMWQTEKQNYSPGQGSPESIPMGKTPNGIDVPLVVLTLLADSTRPLGLG